MPLSDEELMLRVQMDEGSAFDILYSRYSALLTGFMLRHTSHSAQASDLVQETFLQLYRARKDYDPDRALKPWLMTIALNIKREYFRQTTRRRDLPTSTGIPPEQSVNGHDPELAERERVVHQALSQLPEDTRDVINLHWFEGFSFPEIAKIVGASESAVKVRAHRGYAKLKKKLADFL